MKSVFLCFQNSEISVHRNRTGTMRFRTDDLRGLGLSTVGGFEDLKVIIKIKFDDYQIEVPVIAKSIIDNNLKNQHVSHGFCFDVVCVLSLFFSVFNRFPSVICYFSTTVIFLLNCSPIIQVTPSVTS